MAARAALRAWGDAEPNPMVGAVVVRDGRVLGIGHHVRFGELHAERAALARCRALGNDPRGATVYCTLEPCRHVGKQPPCTEALVEAGVARVVFARPDPGRVSGGGCAVLTDAGVRAEVSDASRAAVFASDPFVVREREGRAWTIVKWAQTADGALDTRDRGRRWISGEIARRRVHRMRARVGAVITGAGTVVADDPMLTARGVGRVRRVARRVVVDTNGRTPVDAAVIRGAGEIPTTMVVGECAGGDTGVFERAGVDVMRACEGSGGVELRAVLEALWRERNVATALVEGGPKLIGSMLEEKVADVVCVHVAGTAGDAAVSAARGFMPALADERAFELIASRRVGKDGEVLLRRCQPA